MPKPRFALSFWRDPRSIRAITIVSIGVLHGPWLPSVALVIVAAIVWRGKPPPSRDLWFVSVLTLCAAGTRFAWGLWGPLHINGQGPLWVRGALDPEPLRHYGPGYFELFAWVAQLTTPPDRAVFAANALLSALSPALLYITARLVGVARGGALAAAAVLAADAVTVRTAATEGYYVAIIFLLLAVQATLALAVRIYLRGDRLAAAGALGAAGLLAAAMVRIHPVGYLPLALAPLVVLGAAGPERWRHRLTLAGLSAAAIAAAVLFSSGGIIWSALTAPEATGHAFDSLGRKDAELLAMLLVAAWFLRRWSQPVWLPLLAVCSLTVMRATYGAYTSQQHPLWGLCYQRLFWPGVLLGAAAVLPQGTGRTWWALGAAAAGITALFVPASPYLGVSTTEALEYNFLHEVLPSMPAGCTLAAVSRAGMRVWEIPNYLVPRINQANEAPYLNVEHAADLRAVAKSGDCLLYVHSSLCTSIEARALCESVERAVPLQKVASRTFPAAPSRLDLPYDRSEVEVVVFLLPGESVASAPKQPALADGAPITPALAQALYDRIRSLREGDGCRVERLDTGRFSMTIVLQSGSGAERMLGVSTAAGNNGRSRTAGAWTLTVPPELETDCARTLAAVEAVLSSFVAPPSSVPGQERAPAPYPDRR